MSVAANCLCALSLCRGGGEEGEGALLKMGLLLALLSPSSTVGSGHCGWIIPPCLAPMAACSSS